MAKDVKQGDEIRVFDLNGSRMGQPPGGWVGTVEKVGRTLAHISYRRGRDDTDAFRLEDGKCNDGSGHRSFKTLAEAEHDTRRATAVDFLRANGLDLNRRRTFTLAELEALADAARRL